MTAEAAFREARARVVAALTARFRDLDLAEEAFADACLATVTAWRKQGPPLDTTAWLYRAAHRRAVDALRRRRVRANAAFDERPPPPTPEDSVLNIDEPIPDERLRLIFICCHPAIAAEARAALTLKVVCGLSTERLARAFLVAEPAMLQRITRAKRKIRDAGVPFETPRREMWAERLEAVLATLEIAYGQAYEDAAGLSDAAGLAGEVLRLSGVLAQLLPAEPEVLGLAALVRLAEARRPARLASDGAMVPLSEQDTALWDSTLIREGAELLDRAGRLKQAGPYQLMAAIHAGHTTRIETGSTPWRDILGALRCAATRQAFPGGGGEPSGRVGGSRRPDRGTGGARRRRGLQVGRLAPDPRRSRGTSREGWPISGSRRRAASCACARPTAGRTIVPDAQTSGVRADPLLTDPVLEPVGRYDEIVQTFLGSPARSDLRTSVILMSCEASHTDLNHWSLN